MKVAVTGGTGFIGNYVVQELLRHEIAVLVTGTNLEKAKSFPWFEKVAFCELNLGENRNEKDSEKNEIAIKAIADCQKLIHLVWAGLPNYKSLFHFEENLMPQYFFLQKVIESGVKDLTITGTCFEYGMKNGALSPTLPADPQNPYALAKDTLRKFLEQLQTQNPFQLKWMRLFYMYGKGQSEKSILSQLAKAIENGETTFNMSGGAQLRDYLPVETVAEKLVEKALDNDANGVFNVCSGVPISIRELVEQYLRENDKKIALHLGYYPYPDYEPMAFWGENT